jgi:uncharacterized protein YcnI
MRPLRTLSIAAVAALVIAVPLLAPGLATGHAVVSPMQPQGPLLTAARTLFVLRVPNERSNVGTFKVRLSVPPVFQEGISFKRVPGWKMALKLRDTGKQDEEGAPIEAVTSVTWTARTRDDELDPHYFGEFEFRAQNPIAPQSVCFPVAQVYRKDAQQRKGGEVVHWNGNAQSETPASCVNVVAGP